MRCLVTGGAGFIGSHLVDRLIEDGHKVHVWDNLVTGKHGNVNYMANFEYIDITRYRMQDYGFETIFHLAATSRIQPSFADPVITHVNNVDGTLEILELARVNKSRVVYAGSCSAYDDTYSSPYALTKWVGEQYCKMYNKVYKVPVAIARFFNVYGERQLSQGDYATVVGIFQEQRRKGEPLTITGTGDKKRDFVHVNDVVVGLIEMSQESWNAEIFNLRSGSTLSIKELAELFCSEQMVYLPSRDGEAQDMPDTNGSEHLLKYKPTHNIQDYVKSFLESLN